MAFWNSALYKYMLFGAVGIILGLKIIPPTIIEVFFVFFSLIIVIAAFKRDLVYVFSLLSYLLLIEPFSRTYLLDIPYLFLEYFMIMIMVIYQFNPIKKIRKNHVWLIFFILVLLFEILNTSRTIDLRYTRSIIVNSFTLFSALILGAQSSISNQGLVKLCSNLSYAGFLLTCIVGVAHFQGDIKYSLESNFEASNGLAPVQLSFYLAVTLFITYFKYLEFKEKNSKLTCLAVMAAQITIMGLTFSRGGIYFFAAMFLLININAIRRLKFNPSYLLNFFFTGLVGYFVFYFVVDKTGGIILERYSEKGASKREDIIAAGIEMYKDNPIFGIGTGNFNMVAREVKYFGEVSGAHNEFIRILAEHGFLAIIFYFLFFIYLLKYIYKYRSLNKFYIFSIIMFLAFNFGSIHNGLKLGLQSFVLFISIAYTNSYYRLKKPL